MPHIASISYGWAEADQCQQGIGGSECQQLGVDSEQYVKRVNTEVITTLCLLDDLNESNAFMFCSSRRLVPRVCP